MLNVVDQDDLDPDVNLHDLSGPNLCRNYTLSEYCSETFSNYDISLLNFNIRSFHSNKASFELFLESIPKPFDLIVLTETWNTDLNLNLCFLDNYDSFHTVRKNILRERGGGVSIFTSKSFQATKINRLCLCTDAIETCVVRIQFENRIFFIIGIYRQPSDSTESFMGSLESLLSDEILRNMPIHSPLV